MFVHDRPVPADWQRELEQIVPRTDRVPWLKIVFQPGMVYEPIARFEIYEMIPSVAHVPFDVMDSLRGPCPRDVGEWVPDNRIPQHLGGKRWISSSLVTLVQWQLYQETGCFSQRFWIIQGSHGGHKWKFSNAEKNFLQALAGREVDTPFPGDLPYAEWDNRVRAKMLEHDKLRRWKLTKPWDGRQANKTDAWLFVKRDRKAEEEGFAAAMLKYLETQVEDILRDIPRTLLPSLSDVPLYDRAPVGDQDELNDAIVHDTATSLE